VPDVPHPNPPFFMFVCNMCGDFKMLNLMFPTHCLLFCLVSLRPTSGRTLAVVLNSKACILQ
jgi:hypothetical protein